MIAPPLVLPISMAMHLRTTGANFGRAITVWSALNTFSRWWNLFPFTFEDFDQALHHGPCVLLSEVFVRTHKRSTPQRNTTLVDLIFRMFSGGIACVCR